MYSLRYCEAHCHLRLVSVTTREPLEVTLPEGARWGVPDGATGPFAGQAGKVAAYEAGAFVFVDIPFWSLAWVGDQQRYVLWNGSAWVPAVIEGTGAMPIYLRFASRAAAEAALAEAGLAPPDPPAPIYAATIAGTRCDVEVIGTLSLPTGAVIEAEDGTLVEVRAPVAGWHVNLLWWGEEADAPDFGDASVSPTAPQRTFAE